MLWHPVAPRVTKRQLMLDQGWYSWFAPLIAVGELAVGIALIVGAFVGIAAFFGALMNWSFIMAGPRARTGCCSRWRSC